jgi:hypothetical protein
VFTLVRQPDPGFEVQLGIARIHRQQIIHRCDGIDKIGTPRQSLT